MNFALFGYSGLTRGPTLSSCPKKIEISVKTQTFIILEKKFNLHMCTIQLKTILIYYINKIIFEYKRYTKRCI